MMSTPEPLYILGAGMHPWGKWGNDSPNTGWPPPAPPCGRPGLDWRQIQLVAGADTIRNGYPGFVAGATFAQKLGWNGVPVSRAMPHAPAVRRRCRAPGRRSWPVFATSRW